MRPRTMTSSARRSVASAIIHLPVVIDASPADPSIYCTTANQFVKRDRTPLLPAELVVRCRPAEPAARRPGNHVAAGGISGGGRSGDAVGGVLLHLGTTRPGHLRRLICCNRTAPESPPGSPSVWHRLGPRAMSDHRPCLNSTFRPRSQFRSLLSTPNALLSCAGRGKQPTKARPGSDGRLRSRRPL